jgi:hypothetical protein
VKYAQPITIVVLIIAVGVLVFLRFQDADQVARIQRLEKDKVRLQLKADSIEAEKKAANLSALQAWTEKAKSDQVAQQLTLRNQIITERHERLLKSRAPHLADTAIVREWTNLFNR